MPRNSIAYDDDFFAWTQEQARLLRASDFSQVDIENVVEELESMGKSVRRELRNRLALLIMQLLKWQHQPVFRSRSWSSTIREQRGQILELLDESPSLGVVVTDGLTTIYASAIRKAARETGLAETTFPALCPFTAEQILADDFMPE